MIFTPSLEVAKQSSKIRCHIHHVFITYNSNVRRESACRSRQEETSRMIKKSTSLKKSQQAHAVNAKSRNKEAARKEKVAQEKGHGLERTNPQRQTKGAKHD